MINLSDDKKVIKKIFDFNQDAKHIFTEFIMFPEGICIGNTSLTKGKHFIVTDTLTSFVNEIKNPIIFSSKPIFESIKNNKKIIDSIILDEDKSISFYSSSTKEKFNIGRLYESTDISLISENKFCFDFNESKDNIKEWINLDSIDIERLVGNELLTITNNNFKTRIGRDLMPGLKKSNLVSISFKPESKNIFKVILKTNRASLESYHIYSAFYF